MSNRLTVSQILNALLVLSSVVAPVVIGQLAQSGVHVNPVHLATASALAVVVAGSCRSLLTRFSGTGTGIQAGPDTKAAVAQAQAVSADPPPEGVEGD